MMADFIRHSKADYSDYIVIILKYILSRVADPDNSVLVAVHEALSTLCGAVQEELEEHITFIMSCITSTG